MAGLLIATSLLLAACDQTQTTTKDPSLPNGWTWYHDARFSYQVPVPPDWQATAFNDDSVTTKDCAREVYLLPPGEHTEVGYLSPSPRVPEYISIFTIVNCQEWQQSDIPWLQPLPDPLTISGAPADFYGKDFTDPGTESYHRRAVTHFGGHQYVFSFEYDTGSPNDPPVERAQTDLALYMQVLQGFKYTGK